MNTKLSLALAAALVAMPFAFAHFPPAPNPNCNDGTDGLGGSIPHDFIGASSATVTTGALQERGAGITVVFDGSLLPCGTEDFCPDGENLISEDLVVHTVTVTCDELPDDVAGIDVPIGDNEYEFGLSGAFLPASHHDPLTKGYTVEAAFTEGGFIFCSDAENDGDCEFGSADCFETHAASGSYPTACPAGADDGWWMFTKCNATALSGSHLWGEGPLTGDDDDNGRPNGQQDTDDDGIPNSLQDDDNLFMDGDGIPDILEDTDNNGIPDGLEGNTLEPSAGSPDAGTNCLVSGHLNDGM